MYNSFIKLGRHNSNIGTQISIIYSIQNENPNLFTNHSISKEELNPQADKEECSPQHGTRWKGKLNNRPKVFEC